MNRFFFALPKTLHPLLHPLLTAPVTHITSFLILHELTALIPLIGLTLTFHYTQWLPPLISEGKWVAEGIERFGRYFRRKGWLGAQAEGELHREVEERQGHDAKGQKGRRDLWWNRGEGSVRWVVEIASAWAVVKLLIPVRIAVSVWGMAWFARVVVSPVGRGVGRMFRRRRGAGPVVAGGGSGGAASRK
ncbi:MAG: hypothetical protein M1817_000540 [Caeruleum heppii]|nr:MAG: hypothetical protein M1817_000540 [Caeruleum heppii]